MEERGALTGAQVIVGKRLAKSYAVTIQFPDGVDPLIAYSNDRRQHIETLLVLEEGTVLTLGHRTTAPGRRGTMWVKYSVSEPQNCRGLHITTIDGKLCDHMPAPSKY